MPSSAASDEIGFVLDHRSLAEAGRRLVDLPGFPRVQMGRASDFFTRLERALAERTDVPVWDGELYLEYHRGTYTSQARQKLRNALSQRLYHAAELYASIARALLGAAYPRHGAHLQGLPILAWKNCAIVFICVFSLAPAPE